MAIRGLGSAPGLVLGPSREPAPRPISVLRAATPGEGFSPGRGFMGPIGGGPPRYREWPPEQMRNQWLSLTASAIGNFAGFSDWRIATRASREGPGEGDDKTSADGCDRVRHIPFGADRRRLGVGNRREAQIPRRAGCKAVLRGEGRRVRRSGSRRRRYRVWRGGESRATHALRNRQSRAPA